MAVSIDGAAADGDDASNGPTRPGRRRPPPRATRRWARRGPGRRPPPRCRLAGSARRSGRGGRWPPRRVGDEQHPAGVELPEVVADLGRGAGAELQRGCAVREDCLGHGTNLPSGHRASAWRDHVEDVGTAPRSMSGDRHPGDRVGGAADLEDPGLARRRTVAAKTRCTPWKSSRRPDGAVPSKWRGADVEQLTRPCSRGRDSSWTSRTSAARGSSPWSMPPPGSVQEPGWGPRSELRVSSTSGRRRDETRAYAATRCSWKGWCSRERLGGPGRPPGPSRRARRPAGARPPPPWSRRPRRRAAPGSRPAPSRRRRSAARGVGAAARGARCALVVRSRRAPSRR